MTMHDGMRRFGERLFDDRAMRNYLPEDIYRALRATRDSGQPFRGEIANAVANAMKHWAMERGATHYSHWFQPLTGTTAEKHEAFLVPGADHEPITRFSGSALIQSEPDASSFPSGGLRSTFEARGYTAWDPTSYAFVREHTLYIPTAFISYTGEALDEKTPLLRSMEVLNTQALRILRLFGHDDVQSVHATVGAEQEYFLIDESAYRARPDLSSCGRTLLGAPAVRGQELEAHYYGAIRPRVRAFMHDADCKLWELGVYAKTKHDEAAPCQHELASVFTVCNVAADENQLVMEILQEVAADHGFRCLLHEKPFRGLNGSGKHNNWSLATDTGVNLLNPGRTPADNRQFLLFLLAVVRGVDRHQGLLRAAAASASNDLRLGTQEAPPPIISIFLGDELTAILRAYESGTRYEDSGEQLNYMLTRALPRLLRDGTDRNRTSPLAFTGDKFEYRMPGASQPVSFCNTILNTLAAESLMHYANRLAEADDLAAATDRIIREAIGAHKRIIFNGDNYAEDWPAEAASRGLLAPEAAPAALAHLTDPETIRFMTSLGVLSQKELEARQAIGYRRYIETVMVEARTLRDMVRRAVLPAVLKQSAVYLEHLNLSEDDWVRRLHTPYTRKARRLVTALEALERAIQTSDVTDESLEAAERCRREILPAMAQVREVADRLEALTDTSLWPFPSYTEMLLETREGGL